MKANELRIGNWIYDSSNTPVKVTAQRISDIDNELVIAKPIPLTEEIFIKCGAVKDEYGLSIQYDEYKNTFNLLSDGSIQWQHDRTPMSNFSHIRHLHEFQNLYYSITGGELKIQL